MSLLQALILGIVEGLTEYLPISSTGHLILAQRAMGIPDTPAANAYAICIQAGAILAVLGLYLHRLRQMSWGLIGRDETGRRLLINLTAGFIPAAVIGLLFNDVIERYLFGLWPITFAWFVGGVGIFGVVWYRRRRSEQSGAELDRLTFAQALIIGFIQCLAMWPGTSRSLVTIVGGILVGLNLAAAVEFSFLLGVVTLGAATAYKAIDQGPTMVEAYGWDALIAGFVMALASAVVAVKWMVTYLRRHGLEIFGYYRIALAVIVAVLLVVGVL